MRSIPSAAVVSFYLLTQILQKTRRSPVGRTRFALRTSLRLQFGEQLLDTILLFERGQALFDIVRGNL